VTKTNKVKVGEIGVDAGLCWIGDPCYILHKKEPPREIGKNWGEFCDILHSTNEFVSHKQFNYDLGHPGLGVVVSTGHGDGVYPVYADIDSHGTVHRVWVEFMGEDDD
jgi:hypothetical protein